jgi:hypothetical protein
MKYSEAMICIDEVVTTQKIQLNESRELNKELGKELGILKDAIIDFMKDLDRNLVEIPQSMHDDWNELERLTDL